MFGATAIPESAAPLLQAQPPGGRGTSGAESSDDEGSCQSWSRLRPVNPKPAAAPAFKQPPRRPSKAALEFQSLTSSGRATSSAPGSTTNPKRRNGLYDGLSYGTAGSKAQNRSSEVKRESWTGRGDGIDGEGHAAAEYDPTGRCIYRDAVEEVDDSDGAGETEYEDGGKSTSRTGLNRSCPGTTPHETSAAVGAPDTGLKWQDSTVLLGDFDENEDDFDYLNQFNFKPQKSRSSAIDRGVGDGRRAAAASRTAGVARPKQGRRRGKVRGSGKRAVRGRSRGGRRSAGSRGRGGSRRAGVGSLSSSGTLPWSESEAGTADYNHYAGADAVMGDIAPAVDIWENPTSINLGSDIW